ncbi:MAG: right-handed parallel beta-helix repeat-containing protein [Phycisphaerales bacterium]|nr:right-handed parallel beta-helix repeat-containing protein [Phycisphaerales bacterium]
MRAPLAAIASCSIGVLVSSAALANDQGQPPATSVLEVPGDYATIAEAVAAANAGDTVLVGEGTWVEHMMIDKDIVLRASGAREATLIAGGSYYEGAPAGLTLEGVTPGCVIEGFTFSGFEHWAVKFTGDPVIRNCAFQSNGHNAMDWGNLRAVGLQGEGSPLITDCLFDRNSYLAHSGANGSALFLANGSPRLENCTFTNNYTAGNCESWGGAACFHQCTIELVNCIFEYNAVEAGSCGGSALEAGGAIFADGGSMTLSGCRFTGNQARSSNLYGVPKGGAISTSGVLHVAACVFSGNWAGSHGWCDTCFGSGGAISAVGGGTISDSRFLENGASYTQWTWPAGQAINVDGGFAISNTSFCPDGSGNDAAIAGYFDEGEDLVACWTCSDSGPCAETACAGDVDGDGDSDVTDLLAVLSAWGSDDDQVDLDADGTIDIQDLLMLLDWYGSC